MGEKSLYTIPTNKQKQEKKKSRQFIKMLAKDFSMNKYIYLIALPGIIYYLLFHYVPMYGIIIAFKKFSVAKGIIGSPWVGFTHFKNFFKSFYFGRLIKNTLLINIYDLLWGFPAPIIFALLLNEVRNKFFKKTIQTVTYLPHFISMIVICGMIVDFVTKSGLINDIVAFFGGTRTNFLIDPKYFRTIYIASGIWQSFGWGSIIYLAALTNIDPELYEAAVVDGANKWKQTLHITLPGLKPTIVILLILRMGSMMSVGFEKIILLYNPSVYETADVISSFVYRQGIQMADYSYSAAIGLFNSLINLILILISNKISRIVNETSLW